MAQFFRSSDVPPNYLQGKRIAIVGYGNQGRTHALNLRDSGHDVRVGARPEGAGWQAAASDGFAPVEIPAASQSEIVMLALSDVPMAEVFRDQVAPSLGPGQTLLFCHGFNLRYRQIVPEPGIDVGVVSPKGSGHSLRAAFEGGRSLPSLVAVHEDASGNALNTVLAYSSAIGCGDLMVLSSVAEETETDLFGEQAVLCGGIMEMLKSAFAILVEAGYQPEAAFFECVWEAKLIVDLLLARGLDGMRTAISDTAEWGGYLAGPAVINEESRKAMRKLLADIRDDSFAQTWLDEANSGATRLSAFRKSEQNSELELVWRNLVERGLR